MKNLSFTLTKKNPSEFLVEQWVKSNEQRAKSNEQKVTSNEQRARSNKQRATSKMLERKIMWLSWHYHQVIINKPLLNFEKKLWLSATILWKDTLFECYWTLKRHFGRVLLDFEKTLRSSASGLWKDTLVACYWSLKRHFGRVLLDFEKTRISPKGEFFVHKIKSIKVTSNIMNLWITWIFFQKWISRE